MDKFGAVPWRLPHPVRPAPSRRRRRGPVRSPLRRSLCARAAYHLGNRHTPVEVGAGWLCIGADELLAAMLRGLGATVTALRAPFEPEAGAYGAGRHSHSGEAKHAGIIHDFIARAPGGS